MHGISIQGSNSILPVTSRIWQRNLPTQPMSPHPGSPTPRPVPNMVEIGPSPSHLQQPCSCLETVQHKVALLKSILVAAESWGKHATVVINKPAATAELCTLAGETPKAKSTIRLYIDDPTIMLAHSSSWRFQPAPPARGPWGRQDTQQVMEPLVTRWQAATRLKKLGIYVWRRNYAPTNSLQNHSQPSATG